MNLQTVIPSVSSDTLTFDSFHTGANSVLVDLLHSMAQGDHPGRVVFVWGSTGTGKTHLLQAAASAADAAGRSFHFVDCDAPGGENDPVRSLESISGNVMVCLDNLGATPDGRQREIGWLSLYERVRQESANLLVAASKPPADLGLVTPDLVSRLSSGGVYRLAPLDDTAKRQVLAERSRKRGFDMPDNVIEYIMRHHARDTRSLFSLLDKIDRASLSQHRRITLPFLRELLRDHPQSP